MHDEFDPEYSKVTLLDNNLVPINKTGSYEKVCLKTAISL